MSRDAYWVCTRWSFPLPHKRRFDDQFVKIGDGAELNQNRGGVKWIPGVSTPSKLILRENNPMHSRHAVEIALRFIFAKSRRRRPDGEPRIRADCAPNASPTRVRQGSKPYCVFATFGGWADGDEAVASSMAGPSGVGTFSQNGTRTRVPAIGAKAISMLRWAARYLITGRSGM